MIIKNKNKKISFAGSLHCAFHKPETRIFKIADSFIWGLIAVSIVLFVIDIVIVCSDEVAYWINVADRIVLWAFAGELVFRIITYKPKSLNLFKGGSLWHLQIHILGRLHYLFSPLLILDLLVVLTLFPALRGLRVLRLLRLLRGVHFFKYSNPFLGLIRTFQENALLYLTTFAFLFFVILLGGVTFYFVEVNTNPNIETVLDGIWWALVTLTTVGYGDIIPHTQPLGRIIAGVVMVLGMFTLALFAGIVGSTLLRVMINLRKDQFRMSNYTDHIVICGYDSSANLLLDAIAAEMDSHTEIIVFDQGDRPAQLDSQFIWVSGDPSKENELDKVKMTHAKTAIIIGARQQEFSQADAGTIMIIFTIRSYIRKQPASKNRTKPLYIVAEILHPENVAHANTAGANEVIETTKLGFSLIAHAAIVPGSGEIMSNVASVGAHSLYITKNLTGKEHVYFELVEDFHRKYGVILLGIRNPKTSKVTLDPSDNYVVSVQNELVYLAKSPILNSENDY